MSKDALCAENLLSFELSHRIKSKYSIYQKMLNRKYKRIDDVLDIFAIRIVLTPRDMDYICCYHILALIHSTWTSVPGSVKDYVSMPKPNKYQSLHTTIIVDNVPIDIQIRTDDMHKNAEFGAAAHINYKHNFNSEFVRNLLNTQRDTISQRRRHGQQYILYKLNDMHKAPLQHRRCHHCLPLPGDDIVLDENVYHVKNCGFCSFSSQEVPDMNKTSDFPARIIVIVEDRPGILVDISKIVSTYSNNIIDVRSQTNFDKATFMFHFNVDSKLQLEKVIDNVRRIRSVEFVERNNYLGP